jgi:hypothetical protein
MEGRKYFLEIARTPLCSSTAFRGKLRKAYALFFLAHILSFYQYSSISGQAIRVYSSMLQTLAFTWYFELFSVENYLE